jgi:hypothetical protein
VTGLGGSAKSIALGALHSCAILVSGVAKEEGKIGCCVTNCAGTDGPCGVGAVCGPRSSVAVTVCWFAGSEACVRPCALRDHKHAFVHVE